MSGQCVFDTGIHPAYGKFGTRLFQFFYRALDDPVIIVILHCLDHIQGNSNVMLFLLIQQSRAIFSKRRFDSLDPAHRLNTLLPELPALHILHGMRLGVAQHAFNFAVSEPV